MQFLELEKMKGITRDEVFVFSEKLQPEKNKQTNKKQQNKK